MPHPALVIAPLDTQVLQTAASLENLAVTSYRAADRLAGIKHGDPMLAEFVARTSSQHAGHAETFNAALARAGGRQQHAPDPRYASAVSRALATRTDAASIVSILQSLEDLKTQTYTRYASLSSPGLRRLFVSVAIVEAEHSAFLLAALDLLTAGPADLLTTSAGLTPAGLGRLPATIGVRAFPHAFYPTAGASAIDEGAVGTGASR